MRASAAIALIVIAVCLVFCAFTVGRAVVRVIAVRRRAEALRAHPTMLALQAADVKGADLQGLPLRVQIIRARMPVIARNVTQIVEASWVVRTNVRLLQLATERMLHSLFP
jgi:HAMP domain-containing protein